MLNAMKWYKYFKSLAPLKLTLTFKIQSQGVIMNNWKKTHYHMKE